MTAMTPHPIGMPFRYGYEIVSQIDSEVLAKFDDDTTPDLTPGGQHRTAMRVARKFRAKDHLVIVRGYFGGLGSCEMVDDNAEDYAPRDADWVRSLA